MRNYTDFCPFRRKLNKFSPKFHVYNIFTLIFRIKRDFNMNIRGINNFDGKCIFLMILKINFHVKFTKNEKKLLSSISSRCATSPRLRWCRRLRRNGSKSEASRRGSGATGEQCNRFCRRRKPAVAAAARGNPHQEPAPAEGTKKSNSLFWERKLKKLTIFALVL